MTVNKLAYWATLAFILTIPLENTLVVPGLGRVSRVIGVVAAIIWLVSVFRKGGLRKLHPFHGVFALFLIWSGLTLFWSVDPRSSASGFLTLIQILGMLVIIWDLLRTRAEIEAALQAFILGAWASAASIIVVYVTSPTPLFPEHQRYTIGTFEVDGIALILALAIPAAWYLAIHQGRWSDGFVMRVVNFAYLPAAVFAMVLTGTRGAVVASIPSALFVVWSIWRSTGRTRIAAAIAIGVAIIVVATLAPPELLGRIGSAADNLAAAGDRSDTIWRRSLQVFNSHPIAGIGLDAHRVAVPLGFHITQGVAHSSIGKEAHNTPISILVETGLVGLAFFGALAVTVIRAVSRLSGPDVRYWASQLAVIAVGAQTLSLEDSKSMWFFCGLAVAASAAGRVPVAERQRRPSATIEAIPTPSAARTVGLQPQRIGPGPISRSPAEPLLPYSGRRSRSMGYGR